MLLSINIKSSNMKKIAILNYTNGQLKIIQIEKNLSSEEVENVLEENYQFRRNMIYWMEIKEISIDFITV